MRTEPSGAGRTGTESAPPGTTVGPLSRQVAEALAGSGRGLARVVDALPGAGQADERDELVALGLIHELWLAPTDRVRGREHLQLEPASVALKRRLEDRFLGRLDRRCGAGSRATTGPLEGSAAVEAMRRIAVEDQVPAIYRWVRDRADLDQLRWFLAVEGGPDAGFDDLVALAQVGIRGVPKVALALNYWDELGGGDPAAVHTRLHREMAAALDLRPPPAATVPIGALERTALGGALATDRSRQPEALGALGILELQAGPRSRAVVRALDRLDGPAPARAFYEEHAVADPRHGRDWLDRVVRPLAESEPGWAARIVRGARWRAEANRRLFDELGDAVAPTIHRRSTP